MDITNLFRILVEYKHISMTLEKRLDMAECGIEQLAIAFGMDEMTLVYMLQDHLQFKQKNMSKLHKEIMTELKFSFTPTK